MVRSSELNRRKQAPGTDAGLSTNTGKRWSISDELWRRRFRNIWGFRGSPNERLVASTTTKQGKRH